MQGRNAFQEQTDLQIRTKLTISPYKEVVHLWTRIHTFSAERTKTRQFQIGPKKCSIQ